MSTRDVVGDVDILAAFRSAMATAGVDTGDELVADGNLHRCRVNGDRNKDGWYVLHADHHPAGEFGYWKRNIREKWILNGDRPWTQADREAHRRRVAESNQQRAAARAAAAQRAERIWTEASPIVSHPYCTKKGITPPAQVRTITRSALATLIAPARVPVSSDPLIVPVFQRDGKLTSLQFITVSEKRFLIDGATLGGFFLIGDPAAAPIVSITEGFATGVSVHTATAWPTAVSFSVTNLRPVAEVIHAIAPRARIVVAADHDPNGVGEVCGKAAAAAVGGILAVSPVLTDFNDLQAAEGVEAVAAVLHAAVESRSNGEDAGTRQTKRKSATTKPMAFNEPYHGACTLTAEKAWPAPLAPVAYHGLVGDLVRAIEPSTEADPAALLLQVFVMFGNVIGRAAHWLAEADEHFSNLFVLLVGETSKARKGTSVGYLRRVFREIDQPWMDREVDGLSSGEGLIWAIRDPITKRHPIKTKGRIIGYQSVIEDDGVDDKRLFVLQSEFATVTQVLKRQGNTLSPVLRRAWDSRPKLQSLTKNSPAVASNPHVSVIGHITIRELAREITATDAANGFANRFLFCLVQRSKLLPFGGSRVDLRVLTNSVRDAVQHAKAVHVIARTDDAAALWGEVYEELSKGRPGLFGAITARAEAQVMRLAMLYALADRASAIERVHLEAALEVWRYCRDSAACIFGDRLGDQTADAILDAIRAAGEHGLSRTDISALFSRHQSAAETERALLLLLTHGLAQREMVDTSGRPVERWTARGAKKAN